MTVNSIFVPLTLRKFIKKCKKIGIFPVTRQKNIHYDMESAEYLISYLAKERAVKIKIPAGKTARFCLFRALCNLRPPKEIDAKFIVIQDAFLKKAIESKGITCVDNLSPIRDRIYLWQGDITTLKVDAVVNAANSQMLGCFCPNHGCIDNAIHTFSGIQLRLECAELMERQGHPEPTGAAKITKAYNLPSSYILHTVGPIIHGFVKSEDETLLASCYRSCIELAVRNNLTSIAFCCISTGEYHFPNDRAARIAVDTVNELLKTNKKIKVIFNVFTDTDLKIYKRILE